jgi:hypothetical protein
MTLNLQALDDLNMTVIYWFSTPSILLTTVPTDRLGSLPVDYPHAVLYSEYGVLRTVPTIPTVR